MNIPHEGAEKPIPQKPRNQGAHPEKKSQLARLSLAALGVVFNLPVDKTIEVGVHLEI